MLSRYTTNMKRREENLVNHSGFRVENKKIPRLFSFPFFDKEILSFFYTSVAFGAKINIFSTKKSSVKIHKHFSA